MYIHNYNVSGYTVTDTKEARKKKKKKNKMIERNGFTCFDREALLGAN